MFAQLSGHSYARIAVEYSKFGVINYISLENGADLIYSWFI